MQAEKLVIGEKYYNTEIGRFAYFAGFKNSLPFFELIDAEGVKFEKELRPDDYVPKGNDTYIAHQNVEKQFISDESIAMLGYFQLYLAEEKLIPFSNWIWQEKAIEFLKQYKK